MKLLEYAPDGALSNEWVVAVALAGFFCLAAWWGWRIVRKAHPPTPGTEPSRSDALAAERFAFMCHEMRTPLNAVIGFSTLALESDLGANTREHVQRAHDAGQHLLHLVNNSLDLAKLRAGRLRLDRSSFELRPALQNVLLLAGDSARRKDLPVWLDVAPDVPTHLVGDRLRLTQVLLNLLDNAIKFTDRGVVEIGVTTSRADTRNVVLRFAVRDTGVGVSNSDLRRLFEPFEQAGSGASGVYGGTGLGLSIVKHIVHGMGGTVEVDSQPGLGSEFSFTASFEPLEQPQAPPSTPPRRTPEEVCRRPS